MVQNSPTHSSPRFDALVIGGGAAGLYTALCLPSHLRVGLIAKDILSRSASDWAQGGIAAAFDSNDSPELHAQDTLQAGAGLCEPGAVKFLVEQAPAQVQSLLNMGIAFDRRQDQQLAVTLEAAHSRPRVLHAADTTGRALIKTLTAQVWQRSNIKVLADTFTLDLWLHPQTGRCQGVCLFSQGKISWVLTRAVILATGGGGQVFSQTTNPALSTGDGVAMGWRAGVQLRDLEFFQFHPTALTLPGAPRFLISEAVRGEGAHLLDAAGQRFMFAYHPNGELAPRDVVSRSIFTHLQAQSASQAQQVWLDLRSLPPDQVQRRFPKIIQVCQQWGVDVFHDPIPVSPAAHYWMGGIQTDLQSQTSIPGLYAVGEVASTGVHGANRLASNSLLECLVFAAQFTHLNLKSFPDPITELPESLGLKIDPEAWPQQEAILETMRTQLPELLWNCAGISRSGAQMQGAIEEVIHWRQDFGNLPLSQRLRALTPGQTVVLMNPDLNIRAWAETQNLLDIGYLILKSAAFRAESRGGHYRVDYPNPQTEWQLHTVVAGETWQQASLQA
ncbi:MAG: L-aspartate oxidase [Acaryochloridaceae cyanobacterium CSU_3_4]|nr:L-aspartate oxidase [Acaryochloridaceae cyanobacterium CSU_3_4]